MDLGGRLCEKMGSAKLPAEQVNGASQHFPPGLGKCQQNVLIYIFAGVKQKIWASRCKAVFEQVQSSHTELVTSIKESLRSKLRTEFVRLGASNFEASWCDSVRWAKTEGDRLRLRF
ncbi:hypothetical protein Bbelb_118820 [Branchiostoma belcheri]|nr:hypothetical protein Bbelb_118820 [Branchiostoma belcheri]